MSSPTDRAAKALRWAGLARALSWLAGAFGLVFVVAFLAQAGLFMALLPKDLPLPPPKVEPDQVNATSSTVNGMDRENQPYAVTAARGWQDDNTPNLVHLETVQGHFRKATGAEYTLNAKTGLYDTDQKLLDLAGDVRLAQKDRFTAVMDKAHVIVEEKKLTTDSEVEASFASGTVHAKAMQITDDGNRILFLNGVKAQFNAPEAKGDATP